MIFVDEDIFICLFLFFSIFLYFYELFLKIFLHWNYLQSLWEFETFATWSQLTDLNWDDHWFFFPYLSKTFKIILDTV